MKATTTSEKPYFFKKFKTYTVEEILAASGLAVPMSMPRYTSAESTLIISSGKRCTKLTASPVLPEAVGPIRKIAGGVAVGMARNYAVWPTRRSSQARVRWENLRNAHGHLGGSLSSIGVRT